MFQSRLRQSKIAVAIETKMREMLVSKVTCFEGSIKYRKHNAYHFAIASSEACLHLLGAEIIGGGDSRCGSWSGGRLCGRLCGRFCGSWGGSGSSSGSSSGSRSGRL